MPAAIFNGSTVKILKDILRFKTSTEIITGDSDDPTSVAKDAPIGSLYIRGTTSEVYVKQDAGSSTNWTRLDAPETINSVSSDITLVDKNIHLVDTTAARSLTLPTPANGIKLTVKDATGNANTNNITIVRAGAEDIDTVAASLVMDSDFGSKTFVSDGTDWFIL